MPALDEIAFCMSLIFGLIELGLPGSEAHWIPTMESQERLKTKRAADSSAALCTLVKLSLSLTLHGNPLRINSIRSDRIRPKLQIERVSRRRVRAWGYCFGWHSPHTIAD
jgi:hypothetical protein